MMKNVIATVVCIVLIFILRFVILCAVNNENTPLSDTYLDTIEVSVNQYKEVENFSEIYNIDISSMLTDCKITNIEYENFMSHVHRKAISNIVSNMDSSCCIIK